MHTLKNIIIASTLVATAIAPLTLATPANAETTEDLHRDANQALSLLARTNSTAAVIAKNAKGVLVFPSIVKAGLIFGGAYGEGVLMRGKAVEGYYNSFTGSWGLQAGAQSYGYVVYLMNDAAIDYIRSSKGWEIGVGPTLVFVDEGAAKNLSTSTLKDDAYAFIFDQKGLMAGVSIEGTKISEIKN